MRLLKDFYTENLNNPTIGTMAPSFGWKYPLEDNLRQYSYRITVLKQGETVWDSGVVVSSLSAGIVYGGEVLTSNTQYSVVCECTTLDKQKYKGEGTFETALLHPSDWKGMYIGMPLNFPGAGLLFRYGFTLSKKVKKANAYICGLGCNEAYVNNARICDGYLNPVVSDYSKRVYYSAYDITNNLVTGDNVVGVHVGSGWYGMPILKAQIYITFEDGTETEIHTQPGAWWVTSSWLRENSIYGGEKCDGRLKKTLENFTRADFTAGTKNNWNAVVRVNGPQGQLELQMLPPIKAVQTYAPVSVKDMPDGSRVYDFGQIFSGFAQVQVSGVKGSRAAFVYAEDINKDGSINQTNLRSAGCRDEYISAGGKSMYTPVFTYHGFRYMQVFTKGGMEIESVTGLYIRTSVDTAGGFNCSDADLNALHRNCVITEGSNMHGLLTDCPQRDERFGWLNDLTTRIYQNTCNYDLSNFLKKVIRDISDTQDSEGRITDTAPYYTGGRPADPVSVSYLLAAEKCLTLYGDVSIVKESYGGLKGWTDYLYSRTDARGIVDYSYYGDWCCAIPYDGVDEKLRTDGLLVSTAMLYWSLKLMEKLSRRLSFDEAAAEYAGKADKVKAGFNTVFFDRENIRYSGGSQSSNAIALGCGLVEDGFRQQIADSIALDIIERGYHMSSGNQGYIHVIRALIEYGHGDVFIAMMKNKNYPGFGYCLSKGATTIWERWEDEMQNEMHSFCHPMFSGFDGSFYSLLAGISVSDDAEGFDKIDITTKGAEILDWAGARLMTVKGNVSIDWKKTNGGVEYRIEIPSNAVATFKNTLNPSAALATTLGSGVHKLFIKAVPAEKSADDINALPRLNIAAGKAK